MSEAGLTNLKATFSMKSRRDDVECDDEDGEKEGGGGGLTVTTVPNGHNMGRAYSFRFVDDKKANKEWIKAMKTAIETKRQRLESLQNVTCLQKVQAHCMRLHTNERVQLVSGVLVMLSFILSCVARISEKSSA